MAHLLRRFGVAALKPREADGKLIPAMITFREAMRLREQFYRDGLKWPYEDVVPGTPQPPPGADTYLKRQQEKAQKRAQREKEIKAAMAKMPQMIEEYRALRRLDWQEVTPLDKLTLSPRQIREKYVKKRLLKTVGQ
mmetsp:Transcript_7103/g.15565  ORF Transcript_7103/g.15565 Transcript_7103/m.15565 type:complete len:137 (-) Transcript_7103:738-1148(-)